MIKKQPLKSSDNIKDDLLMWLNNYLALKAQSYFETSEENSINDIIELKDSIIESKNIKQTKEELLEANKKGLKSLNRVTYATESFYNFVVDYTIDIEKINDKTIADYQGSLKESSTAASYINVVLELLTYIEELNAENFKFDIQYKEQRIKKVPKKARDAMDSKEFKTFIKMTAEYKKDGDEFERARDVLIIRFISICGLTPMMIANLKESELVFNTKKLFVKLKSDNKEFPLPRKLFMRFLNKYNELKNTNKDGYYFYGITDYNKKLDVNYINALVKKALKLADIHKRESDTEMLRTSLAVYLYNNRIEDKQIMLNTIQSIMRHKRLSQTKDMIGFHDDDLVIITDLFEQP